MRTVIQRVIDILLHGDTEYAEFLMGVVSLLTGLWLFLPACHPHFAVGVGRLTRPEVFGALLVFSGTTKFLGCLLRNLRLRQISCFLALLVWGFLTSVFMTVISCGACTEPVAPMMGILAFFNGLIYLKLKLVTV